jgi:hypothetical protein
MKPAATGDPVVESAIANPGQPEAAQLNHFCFAKIGIRTMLALFPVGPDWQSMALLIRPLDRPQQPPPARDSKNRADSFYWSS